MVRISQMVRTLAAAFVLALVSLIGVSRGLAQPSDLVLGTEGALPPAPRDYQTEVHGEVRWDFPRQANDEARSLIDMFDATWERITEELGGDIRGEMTVRIGRNPDEMRALAPIGLPPPDYAAGVAYPGRGLILLTLTAPGTWERPPMGSVFTHELSHIALHRAVGGHPVPRWFTEGMAIHQAREASFERAQTLMAARHESQRIPLRQLSRRFPSRPFAVNLAYAQSADVVGYLHKTNNGPRKLRQLVARMREGMPFDDALLDAYYTSMRTLEREWVADLESRQQAFPFLVGGGIAWVLGAILLPIAWRKRRLEHAERLALMSKREEEEAAALEALNARIAALLAEEEAAIDSPSPPLALPVVVVDGEPHTLH